MVSAKINYFTSSRLLSATIYTIITLLIYCCFEFVGCLCRVQSQRLRNNSNNTDYAGKQDEQRHRRRYLEEDTDCELWKLDIEFGFEKLDDGEDDEIWECHILDYDDDYSTKNSKQQHHFRYKRIENNAGGIYDWLESNGAISGNTVITMRAGIELHDDTTESVTKLLLQPEDVIDIETIRNDDESNYDYETGYDNDAIHGANNSKDDFEIRRRRRRRRSRRHLHKLRRRRLDLTVGSFNNNNNRVKATVGRFNTLVVRGISSDGNAPVPAINLYNSVFNDTLCLKSQYAACSFNQNIITPYESNSINDVPTPENVPAGVVEVVLDIPSDGTHRYTLQVEMEAKAAELFGKSPDIYDMNGLSTIFDFVMFCFPPGSDSDWVAYAYLNGYTTYYNSDKCESVSTQMHEVGHNLGLEHSGKWIDGSFDTYADISGAMGYSFSNNDAPRQCFNAAKNWQLGWYAGKEIAVDSGSLTALDVGQSTEYIMNGIVDYEFESLDGQNRYVVMKIENPKSDFDLYIGYNKASGFNRETQETANKVQIIQKLGTPFSSAVSLRHASLDPNYLLSISDYCTDGRNLNIIYNRLENNMDAIIELSLGPCKTETILFEIEITADNHPLETSWTVTTPNNNNNVVWRKDPGYYTLTGNTYSDIYCLPSNETEYKFNIYDEFGDGFSSGGRYTGRVNGAVVFDGNDFFGSSREVPFNTSSSPSPIPVATPFTPPSESPSDVLATPTRTHVPSNSPSKLRNEVPSEKPNEVKSHMSSSIPSQDPSQLPSLNESPSHSLIDSPTSEFPPQRPTRQPNPTSPTRSPLRPTRPTMRPTFTPTKNPATASPTESPTSSPTANPTVSPTKSQTNSPTSSPTVSPTKSPTGSPTANPTVSPTESPTSSPTSSLTVSSTQSPTSSPTSSPTVSPTKSPIGSPTANPTVSPTQSPTSSPTSSPTVSPTQSPTSSPTSSPTVSPTQSPTGSPTANPTVSSTTSVILSAASVRTMVAPDQPSIQTTDDLDDALVSASNAALTFSRRLLKRYLVSSSCDVQASSMGIDCSTDHFTQDQINNANFCADVTIDVSTPDMNDVLSCDVAAAVSILFSDISDPNGNIQSDVGPTTAAVIVVVGTPQPSPTPSSSPTDVSRDNPIEGCKNEKSTFGFLVQTIPQKKNRFIRLKCSQIKKGGHCNKMVKRFNKIKKAKVLCRKACDNCKKKKPSPTITNEPTKAPIKPPKKCKDSGKPGNKFTIRVDKKKRKRTCAQIKKQNLCNEKLINLDTKPPAKKKCKKSCGVCGKDNIFQQ